MPLPNPVIVVPAIQASNLRNEYPIDPELVCSVLSVARGDYEDILLHPEDMRFELREPMRVMPDSIFSLIYGELVEELREELTPARGETTPVYLFAYDWRMPLQATIKKLVEFVEEVLARTSLMPHYYKEWGDDATRRKVNLVGHSMGGLVIAGLLATTPTTTRIGKVATIGAPYQGSMEALIKLVAGTGNLGWGKVKPSERRAARLTPALYYLLPSYANAVTDAQGKPVNLFDPKAIQATWQRSVLKDILDTVRPHLFRSPPKPDPAVVFFKTLLEQARILRDSLQHINLAEKGPISPDDYLCIAGIGENTRINLKLHKNDAGPVYDISSIAAMDEWHPTKEPHSQATGDGTVPLASAIPVFLEPTRVVCVSPREYGFGELHERVIGNNTIGFHGMLPQMNLVQRMIIQHFRGEANKYGGLSARPLPGTPAEAWRPPLKDLKPA